MLYFASGDLGLPGAMFTASHNPAQYNGIKMCRAGAAPVGQETGLADIRDAGRARLDLDDAGSRRRSAERTAGVRITQQDLLRATRSTCADSSTSPASGR